jgi:hypothetical protein
MSKLPHFRHLLWLALIWPGSPCLAQSVTVRVISVEDGRPMQKQKVWLNLWYFKGERPAANYDPNLGGETDANGKVQFQFPEPAPAHFSVKVDLTSEYWDCGCLVLGTTKDLIQKGIVGPMPRAKLEKPDAAFKAVPDEILILARPFTLFERIMYPFMKG